ncbi:DNA ligase (ATP), partial [Quaeritorhiza haematococci]
ENAALRPFYRVFDCLYLNDHSLIEMPLSSRYSFLPRVFQERPNVLEILSHTEGTTTEDVINFLDDQMMKNEEGIVIKDPRSVYRLGDRGGEWCKIKADYISYLGDHFDVMLVGGFYGEGRRGGALSHFMYAVLDDTTPDDGSGDKKYITFGKVGSGYTDEQLKSISCESDGHWEKYNPRNPPAWFKHPPQAEKPDMIIHPRYSRVIQVTCFEVVPTDMYETRFTTRFPRFIMVREDKGPEDCMTLTQLRQFVRENQGRVHTKRITAIEYQEEQEKREKKRRRGNG